jgi:hypothetical protein
MVRLTTAQGPSKLALHAAMVSTLSFGWQIFQYAARRPILNIDLPDGYGLAKTDGGPIEVRVHTRVWNSGTKPVTVFDVRVSAALKRLDQPLRSPDQATKTDRAQLPLKLGEGEGKELLFAADFTNPAELDEHGRYEVCASVMMTTTSGTYTWPESCREAYDVHLTKTEGGTSKAPRTQPFN